MPQRIQRRRTAGWRMPEGPPRYSEGGGGIGGVEPWAFGCQDVQSLWWTGGSETGHRLHRATTPSPICVEARVEQSVPPSAKSGCAGSRAGISRRPRRYGEEGSLQPATSSRHAGCPIRPSRYALMRQVWVLRQTRPALRPFERWGSPPSPFAPFWERLLQNVIGHVRSRVASNLSSALRQLQCDQARRVPGMAVASCQ